jgi:hypothetical protein
MMDNVINIAEKVPQDQIAELTELLDCEPVFGDPQITETCVYQCAVGMTPMGPSAVFRTWPVLPKRFSDREDKWLPADFFVRHSKFGMCDPVPPSVSETDWQNAKFAWNEKQEQRRKEAIMASWRGDDEASRYYSTPWNVQGLLQQDAIGWLYGAPGTYKTVLAMDLACSIATGRDWCGRKTRKGPVLYISAEGGGGIYVMRDIWEKMTGGNADDLAIYVGSPDIATVPANDLIVTRLKQFSEVIGQPAALIVIDTYAQTSPDDTKAAVTAYEKSIRALIAKYAPGASALVIDHTTKEGATWMGSNAKLGNMDMMGLVKKAGDDIVLSMRNGKGKVKNAAPFEDIRMTPHLLDLGRDDAQGNAASAPVLEYRATNFTEREALTLELVGDGTTYGELRKAWHDHAKVASVAATTRKTALSRAIRGLREKDAIDVEGLEYDLTEDGTKERAITDSCVILPL